MCMNVDIRRGQYAAYCREENILKRLPRLPEDPPVSGPLSYDRWNADSQFRWAQLEHHLVETAPARPSYTPTYEDDGEDPDDESEDTDDSDDHDAEDAEFSNSE